MKILGYEYDVKVVESDSLPGLGRIKTSQQQIQLSEEQHNEQFLSTLLHEVIEALNFHLELNLEHRVIMALEAGLYQVFVDNGVDLGPLLVKRERG